MKRALVVSIILLGGTVFAGTYSGGSGLGKLPYCISNTDDWQELIDTPADWERGFILTADLDFGGQTITPVSPDTSTASGFQGTKFTGTFNGAGFVIKNAVITQPAGDYVGLFGCVGAAGQIFDLGATNVSVTGQSSVGILVGENAGTITTSFALGTASGSGDYVGGLVGYNSGTVSSCYAQGLISGSGWHNGGLIGTHTGTLSKCYAAGSVGGSGNVFGGLVGTLSGGTISNCYASCWIDSADYRGGLIAYSDSGTVSNCFWDTTTSGITVSAGGTGKTTAQMKVQTTFTGWDFSVTGWQITANVSCPRLAALPAAYSGGTGTSGDPYLISDKEDWLEMIYTASDYSNIFQLTADIDFNGQAITPVAPNNSSFTQPKFTGYLNGQGFAIRNTAITMPTQNCVGLFGCVGAAGTILELAVKDITLSGRQYVGGLAGYNQGEISNCVISGSVTGSNFYIGGLVGWQENLVHQCFANVTVTGSGYYIGGLVGGNSNGIISQSCARGSVTGTDQYVGGLVGYNGGTTSSIENCYATGSVTADHISGGLVGANVCAISYCYSTGVVNAATPNDGGLVGVQPSPGTTIRSYWDKETSGKTTSASGVGKTTEQMKQAATFVMWDFAATWQTPHDYYPQLMWSVDGLTPDIDDDNAVTILDFMVFAEHWLETDCMYPDWCGGADLNAGGNVDLHDFALFSEAWLDSIPVTMVLVPGGTFQMGDSFSDGEIDELPVHTVTLSPFYMGQYEITNQQYCNFLNSALSQGTITVIYGLVYQAGSGTSYIYCDTPAVSYGSYVQIDYDGSVFSVRTKGGRSMANDPMIEVSWYGAMAYCNWLSQQEGRQPCYDLSTWECDFSKKGYRLPTEAQWEYAARGGLSGKRFPWGDTISHSQANYYSTAYYSYDISPTQGYHPTWDDGIEPCTSPVGSFDANGYGLYDMAGNVWELCNDWYSETYYSSSPSSDPTGPTTGIHLICRGGSKSGGAEFCCVAHRGYGFGGMGLTTDFNGFRISRDF